MSIKNMIIYAVIFLITLAAAIFIVEFVRDPQGYIQKISKPAKKRSGYMINNY